MMLLAQILNSKDKGWSFNGAWTHADVIKAMAQVTLLMKAPEVLLPPV